MSLAAAAYGALVFLAAAAYGALAVVPVAQPAVPAVSIRNATIREPAAGFRSIVLPVRLSAASRRKVSVRYRTAVSKVGFRGRALAQRDFLSRSGTLRFKPGRRNARIVVRVRADGLDEPNEIFLVRLHAVRNARIADGEAVGTLLDGDRAPQLSIGDSTVAEGDQGTRNALYRVELSRPSAKRVSVKFATADGTAAWGADYEGTKGTLSFRPGERVRTVEIPVRGDTLEEGGETFAVNLSAPVNATMGDGRGLGSIVDDDDGPEPSSLRVDIDDATVTEGNSGKVDSIFTVRLSGPSGQQVTVQYATVDGTATAPDDYEAAGGTLSFAPGQTSATATVHVRGDAIDEGKEDFVVNLSAPVNAIIGDGQGQGTIVDDDPPPTISIGDRRRLEADSGTALAMFAVALSRPSWRTVSVAYATADGTATSGSDYEAASGTLSFAPGETSATVSVPVRGDTLDEENETFFVNLSAPVNATIADGQGLGTIVDDDPPALAAALPPPLPPSTGQIFYVSPTGSDNNPGTEAQPWRTVQHAVNRLEPGQRAYVRAGVYTENVLYDPTFGRGAYGTPANPITVRNYPGETPVLQPALIEPSFPLRLKGAYFRFQGFVVENAPSDPSEPVNIYITEAADRTDAHHLEVSGCEIRYAQSASGMFVDHRASRIQILGNFFHDNNEAGFQHQGIYVEADDTLIANNVVYNHTRGFGIQVRTDQSTGPERVIIANNTVAHNQLGGIVVEHTAIDTVIVNNITAFNAGSGIRGYWGGGTNPIGAGNEAWSNMAWANGMNFRNDRPTIIYFHDNFVADPMFVDAELRDYHLQSGSPAIGRGVAAYSPTTNIEGSPRTLPPNLGAY